MTRPLGSRRELPTIGIDIGGTKVLGGVVDAAGRVLARRLHPTPGTDVAEVERVIALVVEELAEEVGGHHEVAAVGIGAAGFVDTDRSRVRFSPHLAWRDEPLRDAVQARVGLPVVVDNDANAAALAEVRFGAALGHREVLCLTLGTGIGGALVLDGRVLRGANGMAGEFGHMQVVPGGHRCECGNRGCWEQYASGNALVRDARELIRAASPVAHRLRELVGGDAGLVTGPVVTEAAREGDPLAVELFHDMGGWLGVGLAGMAAAFDPSCVVVGGGVSDAGEILLAPARAAFSRNLVGRGHRREPDIVAAALGGDAGLIGAAAMARPATHRPLRGRVRRLRGQR